MKAIKRGSYNNFEYEHKSTTHNLLVFKGAGKLNLKSYYNKNYLH